MNQALWDPKVMLVSLEYQVLQDTLVQKDLRDRRELQGNLDRRARPG